MTLITSYAGKGLIKGLVGVIDNTALFSAYLQVFGEEKAPEELCSPSVQRSLLYYGGEELLDVAQWSVSWEQVQHLQGKGRERKVK